MGDFLLYLVSELLKFLPCAAQGFLGITEDTAGCVFHILPELLDTFVCRLHCFLGLGQETSPEKFTGGFQVLFKFTAIVASEGFVEFAGEKGFRGFRLLGYFLHLLDYFPGPGLLFLRAVGELFVSLVIN